MRNLLSNAIKFTPVDGRVSVRIFVQNMHLRVEVQDSGLGISPENQQKLFHTIVQFSTNAQPGGGSGLGLWISKRIIDMHSGIIGVFSEGVGNGTLFFFEVPLMETKVHSELVSVVGDNGHRSSLEAGDQQQASRPAKRLSVLEPSNADNPNPEHFRHVSVVGEQAEGVALAGLNVFVVDDSALNRKMLIKRFEKEGYSLAEADDGDTAVAYVEEVLRSNRHVDVITLDNVALDN